MEKILWDFLKKSWKIKKSRIINLGINPNQETLHTTWQELECLACELDITVNELIEY